MQYRALDVQCGSRWTDQAKCGRYDRNINVNENSFHAVCTKEYYKCIICVKYTDIIVRNVHK